MVKESGITGEGDIPGSSGRGDLEFGCTVDPIPPGPVEVTASAGVFVMDELVIRGDRVGYLRAAGADFGDSLGAADLAAPAAFELEDPIMREMWASVN